jgi:hypothetical protein
MNSCFSINNNTVYTQALLTQGLSVVTRVAVGWALQLNNNSCGHNKSSYAVPVHVSLIILLQRLRVQLGTVYACT